MASSMNGAGNGVDEIRYRAYLTQLERDQEATVKDKEDGHRDRLAGMVQNQDQQLQQMRKDYDVRISQEAESLDRKLALVRERNQTLVQ